MRFARTKALVIMVTLLCAFLVAYPAHVHATSNIVQSTSVDVGELEGTWNLAFSSSVTSGDVIVVAFDVVSTDVNEVSTVTDTLDSSFQTPGGSCWEPAAGCSYVYYAAASTGGPDTVTITFNEPEAGDIYLYEVSGVQTSGVTSGFGVDSGGPTADVATSSTPFSDAGFLIATVETYDQDLFTPGSGFIAASEPSGDQFSLAEYSLGGVSSPTTFPMTLNAADDWTVVGVVLPLTGSGGGPSQASLVQQSTGGCNECEDAYATVPFGNPVTSGDTIVVGVSTFFNYETEEDFTVTVTDSLGSTFTQAVNDCNPEGYANCASIFYATAPTSGADTVTVTVTDGIPAISLDVFTYELSGVNTSSVATGTGANGDGAEAISTSPVSFVSGGFLLGVVNICGDSVCDEEGTGFSAGSGFTGQNGASGSGDAFAQFSLSGVTSPTTFPGTFDEEQEYSVEVGIAFNPGATAHVTAPTPSSLPAVIPLHVTFTFNIPGAPTLVGNLVSTYGIGVIYNVPGYSAATDVFPIAVSACSNPSQGTITVSGFDFAGPAAPFGNSTEIFVYDWESFTTGSQGWPSEPICSS